MRLRDVAERLLAERRDKVAPPVEAHAKGDHAAVAKHVRVRRSATSALSRVGATLTADAPAA